MKAGSVVLELHDVFQDHSLGLTFRLGTVYRGTARRMQVLLQVVPQQCLASVSLAPENAWGRLAKRRELLAVCLSDISSDRIKRALTVAGAAREARIWQGAYPIWRLQRFGGLREERKATLGSEACRGIG